MRHQAIKTTALMLGILLVAAGPAQAGPIGYADVISLATTFGQSGRPTVDLRLRALNQQQMAKAAAQSPSTSAPDGKTAVAPSGGASSGSGGSLTGTEVAPQQPTVETTQIQVGEVDGTICDCGPILRPGGFPLWPLLGLGALPLLFLPEDTITPPTDFPPIDEPPPPPIPEPATLLLFGSGLLAAAGGVRRRRRQSKALDAREV